MSGDIVTLARDVETFASKASGSIRIGVDDCRAIVAAAATITAQAQEIERLKEALGTSLSTMLESRDRLLCYHARTSDLDYAIDAARAAIRKETTA